jgi:hypothetical protein
MRSRKDRFKRASSSALGTAALIAAVVASTAYSSRAFANEEAASTAPGGSGFTAHVAKMTALKKETEELEEQIKKLVEEKRETDDDAAVRSMTLEIAEKYKALELAGEKLEAETVLVRFHYPEQADQLDRKYVRFKTKSLKDLENEAGIDGKLDRVHERVLATFPVPEIEKAKNSPPKVSPFFIRKPASLEEDVPEKIILKK